MLDLFAGRLGWAKAFAARGWECVAVDLTAPPEIPQGVTFTQRDVLSIDAEFCRQFDFICASPPCQEFSVWGMRHFFPEPKYPKNGIRLFNHTREICEESGKPYVIENVRAAERYVGLAWHRSGPFHLWGNAVPALLPHGISKGFGDMSTEHYHANLATISPHIRAGNVATIPPELANCVAEYAERIAETTWGPFALNRGMESD